MYIKGRLCKIKRSFFYKKLKSQSKVHGTVSFSTLTITSKSWHAAMRLEPGRSSSVPHAPVTLRVKSKDGDDHEHTPGIRAVEPGAPTTQTNSYRDGGFLHASFSAATSSNRPRGGPWVRGTTTGTRLRAPRGGGQSAAACARQWAMWRCTKSTRACSSSAWRSERNPRWAQRGSRAR